MSTPTPRRLAGVRFLADPPDLETKLPRMDIAVFVGFASAGPLNVPVPIDDLGRFQQIFGDDLHLAWDKMHHRAVCAQLAPAVRMFFRNGGRRCWVIRVAGAGAETNYYALPGLLKLSAGILQPAFACARSPGSWFDRFSCGTALTIETIGPIEFAGANQFVAQLRTADDVQSGDLLRLWFENDPRQSYFVATSIEPLQASPPSSRGHRFVVSGKQMGWFEAIDPEATGEISCHASWTGHPNNPEISLGSGLLLGQMSSPLTPDSGLLMLRLPGLTSPPDISYNPVVGNLIRLDAAGQRIWFMVERIGEQSEAGIINYLGRAIRVASQPSSSPLEGAIAEKLTFEIRVREGEIEAARLADLGFAWNHLRCWSALPTDDTLFDSFPLRAPKPEEQQHSALEAEARENPSTASRFPLAGPNDAEPVFLPVLMHPLLDLYLPATHGLGNSMQRDKLDNFDSTLFLDPDLWGETSETLMTTADFIRYQQPLPRRLQGIHAALQVEEATLIAVPDAVQVGWDAVRAPVGPEAKPSDPLAHPSWGLSDDCDFQASPPTAFEPRYDKFLSCSLHKLEPPKLPEFIEPDATGTYAISWESSELNVTFVLEEATRNDFSDAVVIYDGTQRQRNFFGRPAGDYYYRVRALAGAETSNWSNGVRVHVGPPVRYELRLAAVGADAQFGYDPASWLDVHRSLLRVCAARGDLLAVLSVPEHFDADKTLAYGQLLRSAGREAENASGLTLPIGIGESTTFSFGALYHPWIVAAEENEDLIYAPPDGTALGVIAQRSLERGAWIAPANQAWRGVVAVDPLLDEGRRLDLLVAQINQITQEPEGFLTLNADTLSAQEELRPINVRRLLILLRRAALQLGASYVFEPNGPALRRLVQHGFESLLDRLFVRGAFAGDTRRESYEVLTDDTINTPAAADLGQFRVDLNVAPSLPMSFVTVRLVQTGERGITTELL